jgi:hypothetical protein
MDVIRKNDQKILRSFGEICCFVCMSRDYGKPITHNRKELALSRRLSFIGEQRYKIPDQIATVIFPAFWPIFDD